MEKVIESVIGLLIVVIFLVSMLNLVAIKPFYIESLATIVYTNSALYETQERQNEVQNILWGSLSPNENKTLHYYLASNLKEYAIFRYSTQNWNPPEASNHITFIIEPSNFSISPEELRPVNLTLKVSPGIHTIETFSFQIVLNINT